MNPYVAFTIDTAWETAGVVLALIMLALWVRWERRERRRMAQHRKQLAYRDARAITDLLWAIHREQEADRAIAIGWRRGRNELRRAIVAEQARRIDRGNGLLAAELGIRVTRGGAA